MFKIYHNPRCRKSREALDLLKDQNVKFEIVFYLINKLVKNDIIEILSQLKTSPDKLIRIQEKIWKELFQNEDLTHDQLIEILVKHPKLIERPIITKNQKGVIGRPIENLKKFIINS